MLNSGGHRAWICTRCVRRVTRPKTTPTSILHQRRWENTAAAEAARFSTPADQHASSRHDDAVLRELFDAPSGGLSFPSFSLKKSQGLFKNRYLTSPDGFFVFAQKNLEKATRLVQRVLGASTTEEYRGIVKDLDRLSDLLCRVLD